MGEILLRQVKIGLDMKYFLRIAICAGLLSGCASTSKNGNFGPAYGSDFGYRNTQIQKDHFRISYTSRDAYQSRDFALLRAAQIAANEGYSHFKIIGGDYYDNGPNPIRGALGIGLGGGKYNRSYVDLGVDDVTRTMEGHKATETIEVRLMASAPTNDPNVFDAQSVMRNIVPNNATQLAQQSPHTRKTP
jgi:hypothetical protein